MGDAVRTCAASSAATTYLSSVRQTRGSAPTLRYLRCLRFKILLHLSGQVVISLSRGGRSEASAALQQVHVTQRLRPMGRQRITTMEHEQTKETKELEIRQEFNRPQ